jgi:hypothetical protein
MRRGLLLLLLSCCALPLAASQHELVLLPGAAIKGIEATPRMTFIVPWQRSRMGDFPLLPAHSALDELYVPLSSRQLELDIAPQGRAAAPPR